jgi:hypothetical protein
LAARYGAVIVDDGMCLREAVMKLYGLSWHDVSTQDGKAKVIPVCGREWPVRQLLGDLGNFLEGFYGDQFMPERAVASTADIQAPFFVFPSCRKNQALTYQRQGGIVVELRRPGCEPIYDFDRWDSALVDYELDNSAEHPAWRADLEARVAHLFSPIFSGSSA